MTENQERQLTELARLLNHKAPVFAWEVARAELREEEIRIRAAIPIGMRELVITSYINAGLLDTAGADWAASHLREQALEAVKWELARATEAPPVLPEGYAVIRVNGVLYAGQMEAVGGKSYVNV